ncbi:MAG: hypothetical protein F6K09_22830 [Merismopedia sp. SIO2A8]|nr:hypothetical protein [Merismopedia sp. SIO2A8]
MLLSQVQQLESEAFIRRREGVIQAGVFADKFKAQSLARSLISQGFQARVTEVNFTASTDVINSNNPNNSREIFRRRSYFVVIPGNQSVRMRIGFTFALALGYPNNPKG